MHAYKLHLLTYLLPTGHKAVVVMVVLMLAGPVTAATAADQSDGRSESADRGTGRVSRPRCRFRGNRRHGNSAAGASAGHRDSSAACDVGGVGSKPCRRRGAAAAGCPHQLGGSTAAANCSDGTGEFCLIDPLIELGSPIFEVLTGRGTVVERRFGLWPANFPVLRSSCG